MDRVYNFSSGPAMLPLDVIEKAREELLNYGGSGMSIMEIPHTSEEFLDIIKSLEEAVRASRRSAELQGSLPSGRCSISVCRSAA